MDEEIYPGNDGLFCVCFKNIKSHSEDTIREYFERFGNVVNVRYAGEQTGMVFIRYREREEAKKCLEVSKHQTEFSVRKAINKFQQGGSNQQNGNSYKGPDNNGAIKRPVKNYNHDAEDHYSRKSLPANYKQQNGAGDETQKHRNSKPNGQHYYNERDKQSNMSKVNRHSPQEKQRTATSQQCKSDGDLSNRLQALTVQNGVSDDDCPPLEDYGDVPDLVDSRKVFAQDVILANFPVNFDVSDIQSLVREIRLNPVHISPIEITGLKYKIPYCHLFLENDYDAQVAEMELKGMFLGRNKLIAMRVEEFLKDIS